MSAPSVAGAAPSVKARWAVLTGLAVAAGLLHTNARAQESTPYTFVQISQSFSPATDVSDSGTVVGHWFGPPVSPQPNTESRGYMWNQDDGAVPIITDPALVRKFPRYSGINDQSGGLRINSFGTVVGTGCPLDCGNGHTEAAIWRPQELTFTSFGGGGQLSAAQGVNDSGLVVGWSWGGGYDNAEPFIWSAAAGIQPLPGFGGIGGDATGVNAGGTVVGRAATGTTAVAYSWSLDGGYVQLPDLPGSLRAEAFAVNDAGVVVGRYLLPGDTYRVFRWSADAGIEDLNAPAGLPEIMDINNSGDVVLTLDGLPQGRGAYLFKDGVWKDINDLLPAGTGFTVQFVTAINNRGWIVGAGTTFAPTELLQGYVLIPPNRPPVAKDGDAVTTLEDTQLNGTLSAEDADGDQLTYSLVSNASHGTATVDTDTGAFTYTPALNTNGSDTFTFQVSDGAADSEVATMTIAVEPVNDAPTAAEGTAVVTAGQSISGTLVAADIDGDSLTYAIVDAATKGVATILDAGTGTYTYAAAAGSSGTDTFTFRVSDGTVVSNTAAIAVTITPAPLCATDVSGTVSVASRGSLKLNRKTGRYTQDLVLKNDGAPITGPISLVLTGLTVNATLFAPSGTTTCAAPIGRPFVNVNVGGDSTFSRGERATASLEFVNPSGQPITFATQLLAGSGQR